MDIESRTALVLLSLASGVCLTNDSANRLSLSAPVILSLATRAEESSSSSCVPCTNTPLLLLLMRWWRQKAGRDSETLRPLVRENNCFA